MQPRDDIHELARGKWPTLLEQLGVPSALLNPKKHHPCPMCGGKDRFRFTDHGGGGGYICNQCGNGTGVDLLMKLKGMAFVDIAKEVRERVGGIKLTYTKASNQRADFGDFVRQMWTSAHKLSEIDCAHAYLRSRGIALDTIPTQLRFHPRLRYSEEGAATYHPGMVAQFVSPDAKTTTVHRTYLTTDGRKASVKKVRMFAPGTVPDGGAIRLAPSAETMGIAEGIETALSASQLHDVPVWAAGDAGKLLKWRPPKTAKCILIFGDTDDNFAGQLAAYGLAQRLVADGLTVEIRLPDRCYGGSKGADWNDVLVSGVLRTA